MLEINRILIYMFVLLSPISKMLVHGKSMAMELKYIPDKQIANRTEEDYATCLRERNKILKPDALLLVSALETILPCGYCAHPEESVRGIWRLVIETRATFGAVKLDGIHTKILSDLSLSIRHPDKVQAGEYYCIINDTIYAQYAIDVVDDEPHTIIRESGKNSIKMKEIYLKEHGLKIFSKWSEWSTCDRCGKVGRRRRIGICTVKVVCPTLPSIEIITNSNGDAVDYIDHAEGIYPANLPLPAIPPEVARLSIYEMEGRSIRLMCPGNPRNYLIWKNDSWTLNPSNVHRRTNGRIMIDLANILHIRQLRRSDTALYSCWDGNQLIGTIRLHVTAAIPVYATKAHTLQAAMILCILIMIYIIISIIRNRKYQIET